MSTQQQITARSESTNRDKAERISRTWWLTFLGGILTVLAGIIILSIPWSLTTLAIFIGAFFIVRGAFQMFSPPYVGRSRAMNITIGVLNALIGAAILTFPVFADITVLALGIFVGAWFMVWGVATLVNSIANRENTSHWWLSSLAGLFATVIGVVLMFRPVLSLAVAVFAIGIWAIAVGTIEMALAFEIRRLPKIMDELELKRQEKVSMSDAYEIEQMSVLRNQGVITEEEFRKFKDKRIA